jgi:RNA polymerase sigma-70 factor (ECF subfamily)
VTAPSDTLLVKRAASADLMAFDTLVRRYQTPIFRLCIGMLGDEHAAQDAAQDTFFTAWRAIGRFRADAKFSTWLYRIATNRCLKELNRRRPAGAALPDLPATDGLPHEHFEASERFDAVVAAVSELPPEQRASLLLREVDGLTYNEIAEILGVSMTAVKSRIYRARVDLAHQLDDQ